MERTLSAERIRTIAQIALVVVGVGTGAAAAYRYEATRAGVASPTPSGKAVQAVPSSGPVGTRPFLQFFGWQRGETVKVLFCASSTKPQDCADLGTSQFPATIRGRPIPFQLPQGGTTAAVQPGTYQLRAGTEAVPPVRGRFRVVAFALGPRPSPRSFAGVDPRNITLGPPREIARDVPCDASFTPDDRLIIASALFDPRTAVSVQLQVTGAELAWSPRRDRLAIVTDDRKEIRMAGPDGSDATVVVREARGFINSVSWAPDGNDLAYVARSQPGIPGGPGPPTVFVLSLLDGSHRPLGGGEAVAWAPRGDRLAVEVAERGGRAIFLSDFAGHRTRLIDGRRPSWSSDGSLLAFVRGPSDTGDAWVARADAPGAAGAAMIVPQVACGLAFSGDGTRIALVTKTGGSAKLSLRTLQAPGPLPTRNP